MKRMPALKDVSRERRKIAFVLGLTRQWHPDWGGYLLFLDEEGDVIEGFRPRFQLGKR